MRILQIIILLICLILQSFAQLRVRRNIQIPDILGYKTLKCDFHIHTVFSDGEVWPTIRPEEAWREGLDAIAITDHIEYTPHKNDIPVAHNRSYEIAQPLAKKLNITLIKGSEITRKMPPGHINAIFITDAETLDTPNWRDAIEIAHKQGAFIFWNHPGWRGQQSDGIARWYQEHSELVEKGWLQGIEVVNSSETYPEAQKWCLDKKLTMLSNSDIHDPINFGYDLANGQMRPITLVFAKDNSQSAIKEALFDRRTAVLWDNVLIGEKKYLEPIFKQSINILNPGIKWMGDKSQYIQIQNNSDIPFELSLSDTLASIEVPENITLPAQKTILFAIEGKTDTAPDIKNIKVQYEVKNLKIYPEKGLPVELELTISE
jgi:3',5'-nucleoside bisphosphate phosphatase